MSIKNQPRIVLDEVINKLRSAIIHCGLWMELLLKEAKQRGLGWEEIGHSAVFKTGCLNGEGIKERMDVSGSLVSFGNTFFTDDTKKVFEIEVKKMKGQRWSLKAKG
jgi:hypothetical protein